MATKPEELLVCRESFVGSLPKNVEFRGVKNVTTIRPDEVPKAWLKFFRPIEPSSRPAVSDQSVSL